MPMNPYASPKFSGLDESTLPPRLTMRGMAILALIGVTGGGVLGAVTNAVNGAVSPQYFRDVMGWDWLNDSGVWFAGIRQGMFEGAIYGLGYSLLFITLTLIFCDRRCYLRAVVVYALITLAIAVLFWASGGVCGVAYALIVPTHCDPRFFGYHASASSLLCYAWVRGAIWGIVFGGLPAVVMTSVCCVKASRRRLDRDRSDSPSDADNGRENNHVAFALYARRPVNVPRTHQPRSSGGPAPGEGRRR